MWLQTNSIIAKLRYQSIDTAGRRELLCFDRAIHFTLAMSFE